MTEKLKGWIQSHTVRFQVICLVSFSFLAAMLMNASWTKLPPDVQVGTIARHDIRADRDYEIIDQEATQKLIQDAVSSVLPVFDWDDSVSPEKIVESRDELEPWIGGGILVRLLQQPDKPKIHMTDFGTIITIDEARKKAVWATRWDRSASREQVISPEEIKANLFFNQQETAAALEKAKSDVKPIIIKVQAGEAIIRSGDRFDARHVKIIRGIRDKKATSFGRMRFFGTFLFAGLISLVFFLVVRGSNRRMRIRAKDVVFLGTMMLFTLVVARIFLFLFDGIRDLLPIDIPLAAFYGLIPITTGTLLVRLVLPLPLSFLFALVSPILAGLLFQGNLNYTLFYLVGSILSLRLMSGVRTRSQILKVGLQLGIVNALTIWTLDLVSITSVATVVAFGDVLARMLLAFVGGILNVTLVLILMPVIESVFQYLTPIQLLELGSLNHPLLRELIVRAPGTYHHSHMVGTLAEAACEAIGADSLFARVASYFHDIGKMKKSDYFVENKGQGEDRHLALSPSMSALIISSHVKDGMEMARDHHLPEQIIDIIPQHQGTKLISYFYNKAKESEDPTLHVVKESDYRYPGPKPQTREAGVILLADTTEAATRALKDRSPARVEEVVHNMINKNFIDGQLDECELTLKDLNLIAASFVRILMGIYHQRIEYPVDEQEKLAKEFTKEHADKYSQPKPFRPDTAPETPPSAPTPLRRLKSKTPGP